MVTDRAASTEEEVVDAVLAERAASRALEASTAVADAERAEAATGDTARGRALRRLRPPHRSPRLLKGGREAELPLSGIAR